MRAFHGDKAIKQKYVNRVRYHIAADNLIRGQGWTGEKGCAVGCTLETYDHSRYPVELGIPEWLAYLEDKLFENMSEAKSRTWPLLFLKSITPGANLETVRAPFMAYILQSTLEHFNHEKYPDVLQAVNSVIDLYIIGGTEEDFREARQQAWDAGATKGAHWAVVAGVAASAVVADAVAAVAAAAAVPAAVVDHSVESAADVVDSASFYSSQIYRTTRIETIDQFSDKLIELLKQCKT